MHPRGADAPGVGGAAGRFGRRGDGSRDGSEVPRRLPCLAIVVVLALSLVAFGPVERSDALPEPAQNVAVAPGPSAARRASLAVDAAGGIHLAWEDDATEFGRWGIHYASSADGATWTAPAFVYSGTYDIHGLAFAVEREPVPSQGRLYAAFEEDRDIWMITSPDGATWSPRVRVDAAPWGEDALDPAVAASAGRVWVAWVDFRANTEIRIYARASSDAGATWGPEILLTEAGTHSLDPVVQAKGDTVVVAWQLFVPPAIQTARSEDGGATWRRSLAAEGAKSYESLARPDVFLDDLGVAHLAWVHWGYRYVQGWKIWSRVEYGWSQDGLNWSAPARVDDSTKDESFAGSPSIDGVAGTLWVAWRDNRSADDDDDVYASWSLDGVRWGDGALNGNDLRVDDTDRDADPSNDASQQGDPMLRTGGYGVTVAWADYRADPTGDIYASAVLASPLVITEVQDGTAAEARVEVYNAGRTGFDLGGVLLRAGATIVNLGPLGSAPPRGHLVIGDVPGADLRVPLSLGTEGALVWVTRSLDVLATAGTGTRGTAPDPLPGESTARFAGTLDYAGSWTRSTVPSFKSRNGVPPPNLNPDLVLNEVLYNTATPGDRFAELHYRGSASRDLAGYRLVGDVEYALPSGRASDAAREPVVSALTANALFDSLGSGGDNLYLYDPQGRLLDMVGWSGPHTQGRSVARVADGVGGTAAYDDASAVANGWAFDRVPGPRFLELGPASEAFGDLGSSVEFGLWATSHAPSSDYVNVRAAAVPPAWSVSFLRPDRTPLADSPGDPDALPDLGLVAPDATVRFLAVVSVPASGGGEDGGTVTVEAAFATYAWKATASLRVGIHPFVVVGRTVQPSVVYERGSPPPYGDRASVTVSARAAGSPMPVTTPLDVVLQVSIAASMSGSDPNNVRTDALKAFINRMRPVDRGSVVSFHLTAQVVRDRPLTNATTGGKGDLKDDAEVVGCSPWCDNPMTSEDNYEDYGAAIRLANAWIRTHGYPGNERNEILLVDGACTPSCADLPGALAEAVAEGIVVHTVGLGPAADGPLLRYIADSTGGTYYEAPIPSDLIGVYEDLATRLNHSAATDPDPADAVPLVEDALHPYIEPVPGSFFDPGTGRPRDPSAIVRLPDRTLLRWGVPRINVGTTWSVVYQVTSSRTGLVDIALYPDARLAYARWDGAPVVQPIPGATITVLPMPDPPSVAETVPRNGDANVPLTGSIGARFTQAMDAPTVRWTVDPPVAASPWWAQPDLLILNHTGLRECTTYTAEVTDGFDVDGERLVPGAVPNPWSFSTICVKPFVVSTGPAEGAADVPLGPPIVVTFSERMDPATTSVTTVPAAAFTAMWDGTGRVLTLDHAPFLKCTEYEVTAAGTDLDGNGLVPGPVPNPWRFATACPPVTVTITRTPETGSVQVDGLWYPAPATFAWRPGDAHRIAAPAFEAQGASRLAFLAWDDGGAIDHWVTVGDGDATITAAYGLQHPASVVLVGLESAHPATVAYTLFGIQGGASAHDAWSSWVDDGTTVSVSAPVTGAPGERWATGDATAWTVTGPRNETVRFAHQFTANVGAVGLGGGLGAAVDFTSFGTAARGDAQPSWSAWVDAGTQVTVEGTVAVGARERSRATWATAWTVDAPLDASVSYRHQFSPRVLLEGTNATHTVGATWTLDGAARRSEGLSGEWSGWTDAGTRLAFDGNTTGSPPLRAADPAEFVVDAAFDRVIRYVAPPDGPGEPPDGPGGTLPTPPNWKPALAALFVLILVAAAVATLRRRRQRSPRRRLRIDTLALAVPIAVEGIVGLASLATGFLRVPEGGSWLPAGVWVNTAILAAGLAATALVRRRLPPDPETRT